MELLMFAAATLLIAIAILVFVISVNRVIITLREIKEWGVAFSRDEEEHTAMKIVSDEQHINELLAILCERIDSLNSFDVAVSDFRRNNPKAIEVEPACNSILEYIVNKSKESKIITD